MRNHVHQQQRSLHQHQLPILLWIQYSASSAKTYTDSEVKKEADRAKGVESSLSQQITGVTSSLNDYAKKADVYTKTEINTKISDLEDAIETAESDANDYTDAEIAKIDAAYKAADQSLDTKITNVNNKFNNYYTKTEVNSTVETINSAIDTAKSNAVSDATAAAKTYTDAEVEKEKERAESAEGQLAQQIQQLSTSASSTYATKTELNNAVSSLETSISNAQTNAEKNAKDYTDDEIDKIDAAYKQADSDLQSALST